MKTTIEMPRAAVMERPVLMCGEMVRAVLAWRKSQTRRVVKPQPPFGCSYSINGAYSHALCFADNSVPPIWVPPTPKSTDHRLLCPYGQPGDRLWVRETFANVPLKPDGKMGFIYRADPAAEEDIEEGYQLMKWTPSIFMTRAASRITLEVAAVRVERLQQISEADAMAEGIEGSALGYKNYAKGQCAEFNLSPVASYRSLWNSLNLKPQAVYGRDAQGKKVIVSYVSTPWSVEDFDNAQYAAARRDGIFRRKPLAVNANCWVWVVEFKPVTTGN